MTFDTTPNGQFARRGVRAVMPAGVLVRFAAAGAREVIVELIVAVTAALGCGSVRSWTAVSAG
jgi:hypothetical protein